MIEPLHSEILNFIRRNHVATISCSDGTYPHSFCCFYVACRNGIHLVFKSDPAAKHCNILSVNPSVSGSVISANATVVNNTGIQLEGVIISNPVWAEQAYYLRFPFAVVVSGKVYTIRIDKVKYTSTSHGKRTKLEWRRGAINSC